MMGSPTVKLSIRSELLDGIFGSTRAKLALEIFFLKHRHVTYGRFLSSLSKYGLPCAGVNTNTGGSTLRWYNQTDYNLFEGGKQIRLAHKFAAPNGPNLQKLKAAIEQNFPPICFYMKNDYAMGHHVYDQYFYGILCSPVFEGKTYSEINVMVDKVLRSIDMQGRVKLHCQPPSRFEKMRRQLRWRWQLEK